MATSTGAATTGQIWSTSPSRPACITSRHSSGLLPVSAFTFLRPGEVRGNLGQNTFRRGGINNINLALSRVWTLPSERYLMFRIEAINAANTPQFADPSRT